MVPDGGGGGGAVFICGLESNFEVFQCFFCIGTCPPFTTREFEYSSVEYDVVDDADGMVIVDSRVTGSCKFKSIINLKKEVFDRGCGVPRCGNGFEVVVEVFRFDFAILFPKVGHHLERGNRGVAGFGVF